jgi:hypothetical protein
MRTTNLLIFVAGLLFPLAAIAAEADSFPEILICLDSLQKPGTEKLVYAYIDGVKTRCMARKDLMKFIGQWQAKKDSIALDAKNQEAHKHTLVPESDDIVDRIVAGKKDLAGADLKGRDLMAVDLSNADLTGANLESADLRKARLRGANLKNANLASAFLSQADLRGADLTGAKLDRSVFSSADLRGATGLTLTTIDRILNLNNAKLDTLLARDALEKYPDKFKPAKKCWDNSWAHEVDCDQEKTPSDEDEE